MAQRTWRAARLAGRYGALARAGAVCALVALLALAAALAGGRAALEGGAVEIERAGAAAAEGDREQAGPGTGAGDGADAGEDAGGAPEPSEPETLVVHVDGAVAAPGVYELPAGSRADDAVRAAGGLAEGADTSALNLAAPVSDGEKVHVPREGEDAPAATSPTSSGEAAGAATGAAAQPLVNINTASAEELDVLPGVGPATAVAIVEDREANGPFSSPEDLMRVSGIGEKKYARLEAMICV